MMDLGLPSIIENLSLGQSLSRYTNPCKFYILIMKEMLMSKRPTRIIDEK
jgi:hypothetical protein